MYKHILLPLDGSKLAETAIPHAESLAKGCATEDITLIRVVEHTEGYRKVVDPSKQPEEQVVTEPVSREEREAKTYLDGMVKKLLERGINTRGQVVIGDAAQAIIYHAEHNPCDIIVMASHGRSGISRWTLGSVADKVFRASTTPVLMVRAPGNMPGA